VNALVEGRCDPVSGQPESKQTAVRVMPWQPAWQGDLYARECRKYRLRPTGGVKPRTALTVAGDKPLLSWVMEYASGKAGSCRLRRPVNAAACWPGMKAS
jgi:assimilatory nitrate reductase catalytic subunit